MYPFVAIVDDSLILEWAAKRADSAINEIPAVIQRRTLLMACVCICSQRRTGEEGLVKIIKVVAMFVVNPVSNNNGHHANFWDKSGKSLYHDTVTTRMCKSSKQHTQAFHSFKHDLCDQRKTGGIPKASAKTGKSFFSTRNSAMHSSSMKLSSQNSS